jgi:3-phenylpropionate/cinnamic acid dioxygenase small subunit
VAAPDVDADPLESIRQLKARYFRLMDTKRWDEWADVFTEHALLRYGPGEDEHWVGRDAIVAGASGALGDGVTVHHGHMPELRLVGADEATGIWAMADDVSLPGLRLHGAGHYHETYRRGDDGEWRIASSELVRLRADLSPDPDPDAVRAAIADLVARYNITADAGRFAETGALFCDDAVLELADGEHRGREAIVALFAGTAERLKPERGAAPAGTSGAVRHLSATLQVDVVDPERARGRAYYVVFLAGGPDHWGRYIDEYRRGPAGWRIARRRVTVDGQVEDSWVSRSRA